VTCDLHCDIGDDASSSQYRAFFQDGSFWLS